MLRRLLLVLSLLLLASPAFATLSANDAAVLRASVKATPALASAYTARDTDTIAAYYNVTSAPDFWIWRSLVTHDEYVNSSDPDGGVWSWTSYIGRSQAERDAWKQMFTNARQAVNPSLPQVQAAFSDIFSGTSAITVATRAHLFAASRRKCSVFEKLFAAGTGSTASPATVPAADLDHVLTSQEVHDALYDDNGNAI